MSIKLPDDCIGHILSFCGMDDIKKTSLVIDIKKLYFKSYNDHTDSDILVNPNSVTNLIINEAYDICWNNVLKMKNVEILKIYKFYYMNIDKMRNYIKSLKHLKKVYTNYIKYIPNVKKLSVRNNNIIGYDTIYIPDKVESLHVSGNLILTGCKNVKYISTDKVPEIIFNFDHSNVKCINTYSNKYLYKINIRNNLNYYKGLNTLPVIYDCIIDTCICNHTITGNDNAFFTMENDLNIINDSIIFKVKHLTLKINIHTLCLPLKNTNIHSKGIMETLHINNIKNNKKIISIIRKYNPGVNVTIYNS